MKYMGRKSNEQKIEEMEELKDFLEEISSTANCISDITSYYEDKRFELLDKLGFDGSDLNSQIGDIPYVGDTADSIINEIDEKIAELEG
jgi:hypothetical protein